MRRILLTSICSLLLAGCASNPGTFDGQRPYKVTTETRVVTLARDCSAGERCAAKKQAPPGWKVVACAEYNDIICTINAAPDATDDTLGHELRHCFDGAWHP